MMNNDKDIAFIILMEMPKADLATGIIRLRGQLDEANLKLALAKVSIAESQATIKRKSNGMRKIMRQLRSLRQTVRRRRKHAK